MKHALFTLLLLLGISSLVVAGDFEDGMAAFESNDYAAAFAKFTRAAQAGNTSAQFMLGKMHATGKGVPKHNGKAIFWLTKAAKAGNVDAQFSLALQYENGLLGLARDYLQAVRWYTEASEAGNVDAQMSLGRIYEKGLGVPQDFKNAARWYTKAAEAGNAWAEYNLGFMYEHGRGLTQDFAQAEFWYTKAANAAGNPLGKTEAQFGLAIMRKFGPGMGTDGEYSAQAVLWLTKAAEAGNTSAQLRLALMYDEGKGITKDDVQAAHWYMKAAEAGDTNAQFNLGVMYAKRQGTPQDYQQAVRWYTKASEAGNTNAQYNLGLMYANGQGVPQDYQRAAHWYMKAAEAGDTSAQFNLGVMYAKGQGTPQDYQQAVRWYTKASNAGDTNAQFNLGLMYDNGQGVPQDYQQAAHWYMKAAETGEADAQYNLATMYYSGKGVPQDYVLAHMWANLAAFKNSEYVKKRDAIERFMTPGQIAEAQKLAREWNSTTETRTPAQLSYTFLPQVTQSEERSDKLEYERLLALFREGDLDGTLKGFAAFLRDYPKSDLSPNAHYWLGESHYGKKDYKQAIDSYDRVEQDFPQSEKVPAAILKKGYAYLALKEKKRAVSAFKQLVSLYPQTPEAGKASDKLAQLKDYDPSHPRIDDAKKAATPTSTGTGFVVSRQGHVLTNHHVVEGCTTIRATTEGHKKELTVVGADEENDLVVLKLPTPASSVAHFRDGRSIRSGDGVVVVGFPLHGVLSSEANVTTGTVSALAGIGNNTRFVQITAPVQPGNSGGPLLDQSSQIVGVVVSKLNALTIAKVTGDIPQNINFAINGVVARAFLDSYSIEYETGASVKKLEAAEIGAAAKKFTFLVECYR